MNLAIDISLVVITLATILIYTFKGFIKSILGSFKYILSFAFAYLMAPQLGAWISDKFLFSLIYSSVYNWLSGIVTQTESQININDVINQVPDIVITFFEGIGVSADSIITQQGGSALTHENLSAVSNSVATPVSSFFSTAIAFVCIFVLSIILLAILIFFLDKLFQSPGLKQLNRTLGFFFGLICAFINLIVICSVLTLILNVIGMNNPELSPESIKETTVIYKFISNINIFSCLFKSTF